MRSVTCMNEMNRECLSQVLLGFLNNSKFCFKLEGWPAAVALVSVPFSVVLVYRIKILNDYVKDATLEKIK